MSLQIQLGPAVPVVSVSPAACGASGHCPSRCRWGQWGQWLLSFLVQLGPVVLAVAVLPDAGGSEGSGGSYGSWCYRGMVGMRGDGCLVACGAMGEGVAGAKA